MAWNGMNRVRAYVNVWKVGAHVLYEMAKTKIVSRYS